MLLYEAEIGPARAVLDHFSVANRLQHVRRYVWRGGTLRFQVQTQPSGVPDVCYALEAAWETPVLEPLDADPALQRSAAPVVEGRWTRGTTGYRLQVGVDLAVPSAIYIRSTKLHSFVPFLGRPAAQVEQAIAADLASYVNQFLSTCRTVPEAAAADAQQLRGLKI